MDDATAKSIRLAYQRWSVEDWAKRVALRRMVKNWDALSASAKKKCYATLEPFHVPELTMHERSKHGPKTSFKTQIAVILREVVVPKKTLFTMHDLHDLYTYKHGKTLNTDRLSHARKYLLDEGLIYLWCRQFSPLVGVTEYDRYGATANLGPNDKIPGIIELERNQAYLREALGYAPPKRSLTDRRKSHRRTAEKAEINGGKTRY